MRRLAAALLTPLLAAAVLSACSSSADAGANSAVTASAGFGKPPVVRIPPEKASSNLYIKTETQGSGKALGSSGGFLGNYLVYIWSGTKHKLATSTYTTAPQVLTTDLLPGLKTALVGKKMGSRVLAVVPPAYGYGSKGDSELGVTGSDTLVFVVDLIKAYPATASVSGAQVSDGGGALPTVSTTPGTAPKITIPPAATKPPASLVVQTLVKGSGPPIAKGQVVVIQYVGVDWNTDKVFDSSWEHGSPASFQVGVTPAQVIAGWNTGLIGVRVGSRVMLVIPPADGYGASGFSSAGISGSDTLVFVIDVLDAVNPNSPK